MYYIHFVCTLTDAVDFMRDIIAYIVVLVVIVAVAYDGTVSLQRFYY